MTILTREQVNDFPAFPFDMSVEKWDALIETALAYYDLRDRLAGVLSDHARTPECSAHGEGQRCCLDPEHPYGAALRVALGWPIPEFAEWYGASGVVRRELVKPWEA